MSDEGSFDFAADQSLHIAPIASTTVRKHDNKLFSSANPHQLPTKNKSLSVLTLNRDNNKPMVGEVFEEYLTEDQANLDAVIVSILGPKKIGKSFLLDSILTIDNGQVTRLMTRNTKPIINSPAHNSRTRNGDRIIYFDSEGQSTSEIFLWNYFLSSVMIYNLSPNDRNEELNLIDHLSFVQSHLDSDIDDLSPPQLILVRRDAENKDINDRELIRKVQEYGLFAPDILVIHLPFPGNKDVKSKELVDVPMKQINSKYQSEVERLSQVLKTGKPKIIRGNYLSTKILSLTLEPLTKGLNKDHRVSTSKIWDDVVETLSIGFYNFYIKSYSEELDKEFENQKPCDKYTIYKRLNKLKRKVDKKVEGFKNISDDPIFVKYKQRLDQTIKNKENLVRSVNQAKSRQANQVYCKRLLSQLNSSNCAQLIDEYCKSELDDQKTQVLLQNFEVIIREKAKQAENAKNPNKKISYEVVELQKQLMRIEKQIQVASKPQDLPDYSSQIDKIRKQTRVKEDKLKQLQEELNDLRNVSGVMSREKDDGELNQLEEECARLNESINKYDKEIANLRKSREEKMRETILKLENQVKGEEKQLKRLEQQLREIQQMKPKDGKADAGKKDTCCSLM